mgnify:CR=1 FL=1
METVKVTGTNFVRDINTRALINTDEVAKNDYYSKVRMLKNQKDEINKVKSDIDSVKEDVSENTKSLQQAEYDYNLTSEKIKLQNDYVSMMQKDTGEQIDKIQKEIEETNLLIETESQKIVVLDEKIKSLNLDKTPKIRGVLQGIKGQYLIFDIGVINIRKYTGYELIVRA